MYKPLSNYILRLEKEPSEITGSRKETLGQIAEYIKSKNGSAKLTFICTHNSRRSTMAEIWAAVMAHYYGLKQVETYSGGTEATAFNPRAVAAMQRAGFVIKNSEGENPHYQVYFADDADPLECFSKTYDNPFNPQKEFAAVMTCDHADQNCPFIPGAEKRISIPYVDPKEADGTTEEEKIYDKRCRQIAVEMAYVMSLV